MNKRVAKILADKRFFELGIKIAAGRFIPVYWNPKKSLSNPKVLKVIAQELAKTIKKIRPKIEVIAGGATGGISLAAAAALELGLPWVYIRAQKKGYSTNVLVEGDYKKGARAVLLDDVMATGASKEMFIKNAQGQLVIKDLIVVLDDTDNQPPVWLKKQGIRFQSLFTKSQRDKFFYQLGFLDDEAYAVTRAYVADRDNWFKDKKVWQQFQKLKKHGL